VEWMWSDFAFSKSGPRFLLCLRNPIGHLMEFGKAFFFSNVFYAVYLKSGGFDIVHERMTDI
jgi:hypothetical protein